MPCPDCGQDFEELIQPTPKVGKKWPDQCCYNCLQKRKEKQKAARAKAQATIAA